MSATDIIEELPKLTEAERRRAQKIKSNIDALQAELQELLGRPPKASSDGRDLRDRRIDEDHAGELRARLKTFAEDWDRPEAAIYDKDPAR